MRNDRLLCNITWRVEVQCSGAKSCPIVIINEHTLEPVVAIENVFALHKINTN